MDMSIIGIKYFTVYCFFLRVHVHALKEPGNEVLNAFLQKFIQTSTCICQAYKYPMANIIIFQQKTIHL
jgi:hypothetical protein